MTDAITNPHDHFFKATFAHREAALDFVQGYLPPEVVQVLDLTAFEINKDSFIDSELKEHFSDILYKVGLQNGGEAYIYLLFEHKSYPDDNIAFQLLRYMVRIWEQQQQQLKQTKKTKKQIPKFSPKPILPLVIYHGATQWHVDLSFAALFNTMHLPEVLKKYIPNYEYLLFDLSQYSDEEIKGQAILQSSILLLKYIFRDDLLLALRKILELLQEVQYKETGLQYIETVLKYLTTGTGKLTAIELTNLLNEVFTEGEKLMPTIAQQWIEQGVKQGIQIGEKQGWTKGLLEGKYEAKVEALIQILTNRFKTKANKFEKQLAKLDLKTLDKLTNIAWSVETLAEFEAKLSKIISKAKKNGKNGDSTQIDKRK